MRITLSITITFFLLSCDSGNSRCVPYCCDTVSWKLVFHDTFNYGRESQSYWHYIYLENFSEECFVNFQFGQAVQIYMDSISVFLPVKKISILKSMDNIHPIYPDQSDFNLLKRDIIVDYMISTHDNNLRTFEITDISLHNLYDFKLLDLTNFTPIAPKKEL
ncbi:MAG: hypothetical protein R3C61_28420 [Bacteroidia bacterium]